MIVPNISSSTVARIVSGISAVLYERGYHLLLANTDNDPKQELDYLEMFGTSQIDGVIYIASLVSKKHVDLLKGLKVPVVIVGQLVAEYDCVYHDDFHAAKDMMGVLLESGCIHPGCLYVTDRDRAVGAERTRGVKAALKERGLNSEEVPSLEAGFTIESGQEKMKELLLKKPDLDGCILFYGKPCRGGCDVLKGNRQTDSGGYQGVQCGQQSDDGDCRSEADDRKVLLPHQRVRGGADAAFHGRRQAPAPAPYDAGL